MAWMETAVRGLRGGLCALTVAVAIASCGGRHPTAIVPVPTPVATNPADLRYPLDAYELTPRQAAERDYLGQRFERACMRRFGFDFLPGLSNDVDRATATAKEFSSRRYGITALPIAKVYGYGLSPTTTGTAAPQSADSLPRPEVAVLTGQAHGAPAGGCVGEAARTVGTSLVSDADARTVAQIGQDAFLHAKSDRRVRAVFAAWSRCMARKGYSYSDPFRAAGDPRWQGKNAAPSALELAVAHADISCKAATNLVGITFAVEADYQNAAVAKNATTLARVRKELAAQAGTLEALLKARR